MLTLKLYCLIRLLLTNCWGSKMKLGISFAFATYNPMMKSYSTQYYTVAGEEKIELPNHQFMEVGRLESNEKQGIFKIWIDKKNQYRLKQVSEFNGMQI